MKQVTFGLGGYCEKCTAKHDHPLHNLISEIEIPDDEESNPDEAPTADA